MTSRDQHSTILIIGGGIAGCAAAIALRGRGFDVEVFEARDAASDGVGAFLTLAVNGVRALHFLGVDAASVGGIPTHAMRISLGDGHPLTTFPMGDGTLTVRRADLYRALRTAAEARGARLTYGRRLTAIDQEPGGVTAHFDDGSRARGAVLLGADGIGSRVRALIDPSAPRARYLGLLNTGGYATGMDVAGEPGRMEMVFGRRTFFSYLPSADGRVWWFANPTEPREPTRAGLGEIGEEAWRRHVADLVRDDIPLLDRIVTASTELFAPWPMHDFPRLRVWHRGRVALLGDAAHAASPSSGQGASLAIEDGVALAILAGESNAPLTDERVATLFERCERLRRPRVERVIAQGRRSSSGKAPGPLGSRVRDAFMRRYFAKPRTGTDQSWMWEYRVDEAAVAELTR